MAGHSKWANIKHKKKLNDVKKSKLFSKLANDIKASTINSNSDLKNNFKLKKAVDKALSSNMSKSIIKNIIAQEVQSTHEKSTYAGASENGIYLVIECFNLNKNRIVGELRFLLNKYGMELVQFKSISYLFLKCTKFVLSTYYNEKILFRFLNSYDFNEILDDRILLDFENSKNLNLIIKNLQIDFDAYDNFYPKNLLVLDDVMYSKIYELISKLKKYNYVSNIFYNF